MALNKKDLITLAKVTANAKASSQVAYSFGEEKFSYEALNDTLRNELRELAGTFSLYRENKNTIFSLIEETIDDVLPKKVMEQYSRFAEIKTFGQGDRPVFTQKVTTAARKRAKQFITKVGLAGVYEVFKLDGKNYEVATSAYGGAAQIGFEEFLDGRVDFAEVLDIVMEGLDEVIYEEIAKALVGLAKNLPASNKHTQAGFSAAEFDKLVAIADAYGKATIYCTFEFAAKMLPEAAYMSDAMKDKIWDNGYLGNYKGHNVIVLAQSYKEDEKGNVNGAKVIDPGYAYIIPTGGNEKPVKIAFEGQTIVDERKNADMSREVQVYKKVGVAAITSAPDICMYKDSDLAFEEASI